VLEHLPRPKETLASGIEKLKPGGVLYISQPSFPVFKPRAAEFRLKDSVYPTHLHFFSPLSMRRLLAQFPVRVVRFYTHPMAEEMYKQSSTLLDLDHARKHLVDWAELGEAGRGEYANYPYYTGENSELFAFRT